jgi:hypothetical protein
MGHGPLALDQHSEPHECPLRRLGKGPMRVGTFRVCPVFKLLRYTAQVASGGRLDPVDRKAKLGRRDKYLSHQAAPAFIRNVEATGRLSLPGKQAHAVTSAGEMIRASVDQLRAEGRAEGIEVDGPLGRWLEGQAQALSALADVMDGQTTRIDETLSRIEAAAAAQMEALRVGMQAASETSRQGEIALRQARQVAVSVVAEKEEVMDRMVTELMPRIAKSLDNAVVIRERRWNADKRRRQYGLVAVVTAAIFLSGAALASWQDSDRVGALDRCLLHPLEAGGHYFCNIDGLFVGPKGPR